MCHSAYGPAQMAVRYELMIGVVSNVQLRADSGSWSPSTPSAVMTSSTSSLDLTGMFDVTIHDFGASTVKSNVAFRSGWSNTAYTRRTSGTSNWEYR